VRREQRLDLGRRDVLAADLEHVLQPAVEDQATDRAWRLGQQRTVNVHKLVCEGTVEERIGRVIDDKRKLADAVVGNSEAWLSELSTAELRDLVVLETES